MFEIKSQGYSVYIGNSVLTELNTQLKNANYSQYFILIDENTFQHCLPIVLGTVSKLKDAEIIETESGEWNKTIDVVTQVWLAMSDLHADRKALIINLGGGVLGDMGGFIASTYKRGVDFINIPTTLLSQVDSSVGGKLGIDLNGLKNQIGVFNYPNGVFIDAQFLQTLPFNQLRSGFAEVLKHALIKDVKYWNKVKNINLNEFNEWDEIIAHSVTIKNEVVLKDPKEQNLRKILNFGHTIGHAIETYHLADQNNFFLHGEAIAIGMVSEAILAQQLNLITPNQVAEIGEVFHRYFQLKPLLEKNFDDYLALMLHDKKNSDGQISFSLIKSIGEATWDVFCTKTQIVSALHHYNKMINSYA